MKTITIDEFCRLKYQQRPETILATVNVGIPAGQYTAQYREMQVLLVEPDFTDGYERHVITFFDFEACEVRRQNWHGGSFYIRS